MKELSHQQLAVLLSTITKSTVVSLEMVTDDSRSKTVKGIKQVQKRTFVSRVYLNHDYESKVKKLTGDDSFESQEMKGKTRISSTLVKSDKTGEFMLDGKLLDDNATKILAYYHNNVEITKEQAEEMDLWTPSYYKPSEKQTAGRGTVSKEDDFKIIQPYLNRIVKIKIQGTEYKITPDANPEVQAYLKKIVVIVIDTD